MTRRPKKKEDDADRLRELERRVVNLETRESAARIIGSIALGMLASIFTDAPAKSSRMRPKEDTTSLLKGLRGVGPSPTSPTCPKCLSACKGLAHVPNPERPPGGTPITCELCLNGCQHPWHRAPPLKDAK